MIKTEEIKSLVKSVKVMEYSGHIRNWQTLCQALNISQSLERTAREEAILIAA